MIRFFLTILLTIAFSNTEIFASNNPILLTQEAISQRQLDLPKNKDLKETFGNEHPLTLVSIKNLPSDDKVVFTYTRNLFKELNLPTVQTKQFSMKDFLKSVEISKNGLPFHVVQGLGYIPGEEIECFVEVAGFKSNVITITPFPIRSESKVDRACATATIKSLGSGGIYRLSFDNFQPNEEIEYISESYNEVIKTKIMITHPFYMTFMPGVIGMKGGLNKISIKRKNGEVINLVVPWGDVAVKQAKSGVGALEG